MDGNEAGGISLACDPRVIAPEDRAGHLALTGRLFGRAERERVGEGGGEREGYAYRFAAAAFTEVARFVENERRCCPFLSFTLSLPAGGPVWLEITGPGGTRAVQDAELPTS